MKWKGIIFDLDGVLCTTDQYHYKAWKQIADRLPAYFDEQINQRLRGVSRTESLEVILENYAGPPLAESEKKKILEEKNQIYRQYLKNISKKDASEGVYETLRGLQKDGYRLAVGSSSKNTALILERLDMRTFFQAVVDGTQITYSKPYPEVFQKAAEALKLPAQDCLVVEDAAAGVEAGHKAGMEVACVGQASAEKLGDYNLSRIKDILNIVGCTGQPVWR